MYPTREVTEYYIPRFQAAALALAGTLIIAMLFSPFRLLQDLHREEYSSGRRSGLAAAAFARFRAGEARERSEQAITSGTYRNERLGFIADIPQDARDAGGNSIALAAFENRREEIVFIAPQGRNSHESLAAADRIGNPQAIQYVKIEAETVRQGDIGEFIEKRFGEGCGAALFAAAPRRNGMLVPIVPKSGRICHAGSEYGILYSPSREEALIWSAKNDPFGIANTIRFIW